MESLSTFIEKQGFVILDGGLATELENQVESLDHPLWSAKILLSAPQKIADVHYAYFAAGADVAISASYQATFPGLQAEGLSRQQAEQVIRRSVSLAAEARARFWSDPQNRVGRLRPLVAASIGPYGAFLHDGSEYRGNYGLSFTALQDFHRDRLALLADSEADLLACESIPSLAEAEALVDLLDQLGGAQAWVSFTCKDETSISDGTPFADAIKSVTGSQSVVAAGLNCTAPRFVSSLLEQAHRVTNKPLVAYPNSGEGYDGASKTWHANCDPGSIDQSVKQWLELGARLLGGCCRTTPANIRAIRNALMVEPAGTGNR